MIEQDFMKHQEILLYHIYHQVLEMCRKFKISLGQDTSRNAVFFVVLHTILLTRPNQQRIARSKNTK